MQAQTKSAGTEAATPIRKLRPGSADDRPNRAPIESNCRPRADLRDGGSSLRDRALPPAPAPPAHPATQQRRPQPPPVRGGPARTAWLSTCRARSLRVGRYQVRNRHTQHEATQDRVDSESEQGKKNKSRQAHGHSRKHPNKKNGSLSRTQKRETTGLVTPPHKAALPADEPAPHHTAASQSTAPTQQA